MMSTDDKLCENASHCVANVLSKEEIKQKDIILEHCLKNVYLNVIKLTDERKSKLWLDLLNVLAKKQNS